MISIIVPIYNASAYLFECLDSIKNQSYPDFEVICIDDGSSDDSAVICKKFESQDSRFHYIYQKNAGVSAARNNGIDNSVGEYICFVDSDDVLAKNYLLKLFEMTKDGSFSVCSHTCDKNDLDKDSNTITRYKAKEYIEKIVKETISHPNLWEMLFKSSIISEFNIKYTLGCIKNEDTEFYINYLVHETEVIVLGYIGYFYRLNPTSVMAAPITKQSLTSIEASKRINDLLKQENLINDNMVFSNGILTYTYVTAKKRNKELYDYLHEQYDVHAAMKLMSKFPRKSKRLLAIIYLVIGKRHFYRIMRLKSIFKHA